MISSVSFFAVRSPVLPSRSFAVPRKVTVASSNSEPSKTPKNVAKQTLSTALVAAPIMSAALPALALVDKRLNGDGTGLIFGINDAALFWVIAGVFTLVWIFYYISQPDLGGDEDDEAGLSL
eukprot:TRINITY_DN12273_c0_g1_i2.p3 TRINITY_DN12273_c0_g1~~TRINITY_DN12273_c0_g1_i2.p3  ORF type:complete len:122 (+),score=28.07 TRINITY_DN12273_c0_g1_i2:77-442(+)